MEKYGVVKECPECGEQMKIDDGQAKCENCGCTSKVG